MGRFGDNRRFSSSRGLVHWSGVVSNLWVAEDLGDFGSDAAQLGEGRSSGTTAGGRGQGGQRRADGDRAFKAGTGEGADEARHPKKAAAYFARESVKYAFIERHHTVWLIAAQCRALNFRHARLDEPQGRLLGQRCDRNAVWFVEDRAAAWNALRHPPSGQRRSDRLAWLL